MDVFSGRKINEDALKSVTIEIKLYINRKLFENGVVTEEMYIKAKESILKGR